MAVRQAPCGLWRGWSLIIGLLLYPETHHTPGHIGAAAPLPCKGEGKGMRVGEWCSIVAVSVSSANDRVIAVKTRSHSSLLNKDGRTSKPPPAAWFPLIRGNDESEFVRVREALNRFEF